MSLTSNMSTTKITMFENREELARQKMITDATDKLTYMKAVRAFADTTPSASAAAKDYTLTFLDTQIRELKIDADGKPRYLYNLHYACDFGREYNGVKPEFTDARFTSAQDLVEFVNQLVLSDDTMYESDTYKIPSAAEIEKHLDESKLRRMTFDINIDNDEDEKGPVPPFGITRTRVNY